MTNSIKGLSQRGDLTVVTGPDWPGLTYFSTTRLGGVSRSPWASLNVGFHTGDDPAHVAKNRRRLTTEGRHVFWLRQVHGTDVYDVDAAVDDVFHSEPISRSTSDSGLYGDTLTADGACADAMVMSRADVALAVQAADCLPVVLGSTDGRVVGVAHAGWRGLAAGVLENTLALLQQKYDGGSRPVWRAWIGPGISQPYFEVGDDVHLAFCNTDPRLAGFFISAGQHGKWLADLAGIARYRLHLWGVEQIDASAWCTYRDADLFYSYRRDGETGRFVTLVWRNG